MVDGDAKLGGLMFDVAPSFSNGFFRVCPLHLVGLVELPLIVLLDDLALVYLALLMGTVLCSYG
jgi:hypothetical protein